YIYLYKFIYLKCEQKNKPIIAAPGDDVILPCRLDSEVDLQDQTVEWSKLDLHHDPFSFVCYYQFSRIVTEVMNKRFIQRVSLNPDGLKRGDVTLKIRNVTLQDEGKYSCFIPGKKFRETVQLLVGGRTDSVRTISAAPGDDVILPCRLDSEEDLQDYFLEWTKLEMNPDPSGRRFVYLYRSRKTMTRFMMETFIQRVSLNPDGLKRGDVTLKIRNVTLQDKGTYRCYIHGLDHRETVQTFVLNSSQEMMSSLCFRAKRSQKQHHVQLFHNGLGLFYIQTTFCLQQICRSG
uniref:Ig-like domain-containing protein n=1 Tax=Oryzias melastigma TaxID=30732 RepID=A0A3B3BPU6_ORYME